MIKLTSGAEVKYNEDFDKFFQSLLEAIIVESKKAAMTTGRTSEDQSSEKERFLQKIMDNCIYVTHQLFTLYADNEKFSKFIITGFIFNSIMLSLPGYNDILSSRKKDDDGNDTVH